VNDTRDLPLAVDLDGTLIHADLFYRSILTYLAREPWGVFVMPFWFLRGRAPVKARLAKYAPAPETLPYDARVVEWLRAERARGRKVVLASASDGVAVQRVADYLGVFDAVMASDGTTNLKSRRKAAALRAAFPQGFVYAGNESADLKVWEAAAGAVLVNCDAALEAQARGRFSVEHCFTRAR